MANTVTFAYDTRNRLERAVFPGGLGSADFGWDNNGNLTNLAYSDGSGSSFTYDALNRLISADGLAFSYDASSRMTESNGMAIGRDSGGRITSVTLAPGKVLIYGYDQRNLVTQVTDWLGGVTTFDYDPVGRLIRTARPNGVTTEYTYDAENRVIGIVEVGPGTATTSTLSPPRRDHDLSPLRMQGSPSPSATTRGIPAFAGMTGVTSTGMTTEESARMTAKGTQSDTLLALTLTRDANGRVVSAERNVPLAPFLLSSQTNHTFDAASQVAEFTYDALGRLTDDGTRTYSWDLASRLTSYTENGATVTFTYDAAGNRLSRTENGVTRSYLWNYALGQAVIAVERQDGSDRRHYVHTPGGLLLYSVDANDQRRFYHYDEVGSTLYLTDDNGGLLASYAYTPYGTLAGASGSEDNPFTFLGQYGVVQEGVSGLYYMQARYYDSAGGRFLSRDPIDSVAPRSINPYQYALGNPLELIDPSGLSPRAGGPGKFVVATGLTSGEVTVFQKGRNEVLTPSSQRPPVPNITPGGELSLPPPVLSPIAPDFVSTTIVLAVLKVIGEALSFAGRQLASNTPESAVLGDAQLTVYVAIATTRLTQLATPTDDPFAPQRSRNPLRTPSENRGLQVRRIGGRVFVIATDLFTR